MKRKLIPALLASVSLLSVVGCGTTASSNPASSVLSASGSTSEAAGEKTADFSFWLGTQGINGGLYENYQDNPVIKWVLGQKKFGLKQDTKLSLSFEIPVTGSEADNFNTIMGTGEYKDVMQTSYVTTSPKEFFNQGIALDLTPYVDQYMPNYKKWVEDHPAYKKLITYKVNGEDKYLSLVNLNKEVSYWGGFNYRRDWIAKYGKNPTTGAAFTGSWNEDKTKWTDDVIFPNGTSNPLYISDWEWMFDIFKTAMADLGISDGYCTSIPYQGFNESGDLVSSFGGEGPYFSTLSDGTVDFGGTTNQFRTYMKAMSNWYKKGYLDKKFSERTTDIFYSIDSTSVYSGKVGMFYSYIGQAGNQMETDGQPYTKGICVYGASHPINDVYGEAANKGVKPQTFYQATLADTTSNFIVTSAAKDKDLEALFTFLDYMYSDEGSMLSVGLTKEQYERQKEPVYEELGLTDGAYSWVDKDGNPLENGSISADSVYWKKNPALLKTSYGEASHIGRIPATFVNSYHEYSGDFFDYQNIAVEQYKRYAPNVGIYNNLSSFLSDEENTAYNKCLSSCRYFMSKQCPKFINGSVDISSDTVWNSFVSALNKYKISDVLASINTAASAYNN